MEATHHTSHPSSSVERQEATPTIADGFTVSRASREIFVRAYYSLADESLGTNLRGHHQMSCVFPDSSWNDTSVACAKMGAYEVGNLHGVFCKNRVVPWNETPTTWIGSDISSVNSCLVVSFGLETYRALSLNRFLIAGLPSIVEISEQGQKLERKALTFPIVSCNVRVRVHRWRTKDYIDICELSTLDFSVALGVDTEEGDVIQVSLMMWTPRCLQPLNLLLDDVVQRTGVQSTSHGLTHHVLRCPAISFTVSSLTETSPIQTA